MSGRIYFDMTDIVRYAVSNERVSGIQRVQFNLIGHLSRLYGGDAVRCIFYHSDEVGMVEIDPSALFETDEYDSAGLLQQLGLEQPRKYLPPRSRMKSYLRRWNHNKPLRAMKKLDVIASSFFMPMRLAAMGLQRQTRTYTVLPFTPITALPDGAHYVLLGINIVNKHVLRFAHEHLARQGDMVQIVYDLIPHVCPQFFTANMVRDFRAWLDELVRLEPRVVCISKWTAHDLSTYVGERAAQWDIRAIPLAHELDGFERNAEVTLSPAEALKMPKTPYLLCVGTLEVRKNGVTLLRAWRQLLKDIGDAAPLLVFAGKRGWLIDEFDTLLKDNPAMAAKVLIVESPADRQLAWLYRNCLFTVYPSHYEGWGLPVGESAWFGKYGIASRVSSIPEVCGDLIDYVDPDDPATLAELMGKALADPAMVATREAAIRRSSLRRWGDVAEDIFRVVKTPRATAAEPIDA
jgi:glycosyltransferase involved in cell wall biosynthesis